MVGVKGQTGAILRYLQEGKTLTTFEAFTLFGCTKLPSKISDLRKAGYDIEGADVTTITRYGYPCTYKKYSLTNS